MNWYAHNTALKRLHQVLYHPLPGVVGSEVGEIHTFYCCGNEPGFGGGGVLQIVPAGLYQYAFGNHANYFGTGYLNAALLCLGGNFVEGYVQRSGIDVGDVHRHLGYPVFGKVPAVGLAALEGAGHSGVALFAHRPCHFHCKFGIFCIKVEVTAIR